MYKFLISFNYIWFSLIFFIGQPNMKKSFSLTFFSFSLYFPGTKHSHFFFFYKNNTLDHCPSYYMNFQSLYHYLLFLSFYGTNFYYVIPCEPFVIIFISTFIFLAHTWQLIHEWFIYLYVCYTKFWMTNWTLITISIIVWPVNDKLK